MQAARSLQEAFGLRSTVAVLGFSLRTLADQLAKGQLDALVTEHRAQAGSRPPGPRRGGGEGQSRQEGRGERGGARIDPFARPSRPPVPLEAGAPEAVEAASPEAGDAEPGASASSDAQTGASEAAAVEAGDTTPRPEA